MSTSKKLALAAFVVRCDLPHAAAGLRAGREGGRERVRRRGRGPRSAPGSPSGSAFSAARSVRAAPRRPPWRASRATRAPPRRIQTPMILGLALIESLVLMAFLIAFFLQGLAASVPALH